MRGGILGRVGRNVGTLDGSVRFSDDGWIGDVHVCSTTILGLWTSCISYLGIDPKSRKLRLTPLVFSHFLFKPEFA